MLAALALVFAVAAGVAACLVTVYFGRLKPGYSHLRHTISELGEAGSPIGFRVSYFGFVPIGLLVWAFLGSAYWLVPAGAAEAFLPLALVGLGYVGGGVFRCDAGAPLAGSTANTLHNLFGAGEYLGAAAAFSMFRSGAYWAWLTEILPYLSAAIVVCLWGISIPNPFRGLVQRVAETLIFGGIVLIGWWVLRGVA